MSDQGISRLANLLHGKPTGTAPILLTECYGTCQAGIGGSLLAKAQRDHSRLAGSANK